MQRRELKEQAKGALRDNFVSKMMLFIIPIILGIIGGGNGLRSSFESGRMNDISHGAWVFFTFLGFLGVLIGIVIALFVTVITTGAVFNYIKIFRGERTNPQFNNIFVPFYDGSAGKIILLNVVKFAILILLMLIPIVGWAIGIYLALGWSQSTYVLFDQLEQGRYAGVMNVLRDSATMMKGLRGNYFVFALSFFWWYLLQAVSGGLAGFWTLPYINMAHIAYYENIGNL